MTVVALDADDIDLRAASQLVYQLRGGTELPLLGYPKAGDTHADPDEAYGQLHTHSGLLAAGIIGEAIRRYGSRAGMHRSLATTDVTWTTQVEQAMSPSAWMVPGVPIMPVE